MVKAPASLIPWLTYTESLTNKLHYIAGDAHMELCGQYWVNSGWWSTHVLGLVNLALMQREIVMYSKHIPCWYARTLIPDSTWQRNQDLLGRLDHRPLGRLIFDPANNIHRHWLKSYPINNQCLEFYWPQAKLTCNSSQLWMRLSQFNIGQRDPFFLAEILLPGLLEVTQ